MITLNNILKSIFKKKLVVNSGVHNSVKLRPGRNLKYELPASIEDPLRSRINAYWNKGKFVGIPGAQLPLNIEYFPVENYDNGNVLGSFRQKFRLTPQYFSFTDLEWKRFVSKTFSNDGNNGVIPQYLIDKLEAIRQVFLNIKMSETQLLKVIISQTTIDNEFSPVYNDSRIPFSQQSKQFLQKIINRTEGEKRLGYTVNDAFKSGVDRVLIEIQQIIPVESGLGGEWVLDDPRNSPKYLDTPEANIAQRLFNLLKTKQLQNSTYFIPPEVGFLNGVAAENRIKAPYGINPRIRELAQNFSVIYPAPQNRDFILDWARTMIVFNQARITEISVESIQGQNQQGSSGNQDNLNAVGRENCDIQGASTNTGEIGAGFEQRLNDLFGGSSYTPSSKVRESISVASTVDGTLTITSGFLPGEVVNLNDTTPQPEGPDTIRENRFFTDHAFETNVPYSKKEQVRTALGAVGVYDIFPEYNYFIEKFENNINRQTVKEQHIPNMYAFAIEKQENNLDEENTIFNQHITLSGYVKDTFTDVINGRGKKIGEKSTGQYFEKFADVYDDFKRDAQVSNFLKNKFSNIIYPADSSEIFSENEKFKEMFPMCVNISMNTDTHLDMVSVFNEINISTKLLNNIVGGKIGVKNDKFITRTTSVEQQIGFSPVDILENQKLEEYKVWDITEWLETSLESSTVDSEDTNKSIVFSKIDPEEQGLGSQFVFENFLSNIVLVSKMKSLLREKIRTFEEIMKGEKSYAETLFYKIEKVDSDGEILQTFYISNSNKIAIFNFVDTQVKYNKQYKYRIFSCNLVVGSTYRYQIDRINQQDAIINAVVSPSVVIVEVPIVEKKVRIFDLPPVFPDVNIVPIKDANDRIKLLLNSGIGKYKAFPISIEDSDDEFFKTEYQVQEKEENQMLDFNSDDPPKLFEIYRTSVEPKTYKDFQGKLIETISTDIDGVRTSTGETVDFIEENTKYWYVFRAVDIHDNISNPSPVYQVEIVDDGGAVYPLINVFEMKVKENKRKTKNLKKLLFVRPSLPQATVNEQESGIFDENGEAVPTIKDKTNFVMGLEEEKVWGKQYKIRLTSKKTGRKIDINFSLTNETVPLKESNEE